MADLAALYGLCSICNAPRNVLMSIDDEDVLTMTLVCTADAGHDQS
jgi:hypothetical protein